MRPVEVLGQQLQQIAATDGAHAGVVDEAVEPPNAVDDAARVAVWLARSAQVRAEERSASAQVGKRGKRLVASSATSVMARSKPARGQGLGDRTADAAARRR